jgi:hypothetical protein
MTVRILLSAERLAALEQHLAKPERVAFMYAAFADGYFNVVDLEPISGGDVASRSDRHVVLHDDVRPRLISEASARGLSLIEAHSHGPRGRAAFSASDLVGFEEWVPHLWWRLRGRPYAALVLGCGLWDALAWVDGPSDVCRIAHIEITGETGMRRVVPTSATFWRLRQRHPRMRLSA